MKNIFPLALLLLLLSACGGSQADDVVAEDLEEKKALLKEKREALRTLEKEISQLQEEIAQIDSTTAPKRTLVTTMPVTVKDFQHYVNIQGTVQSNDLVNVSSEAGGRILNLAVEEGDNVQAGQLIAELDLEQIKKQIAEVEKSRELTQEVYERQKRLWDQNIGSEIQYLQAKNNLERLDKSLETLQYQLEKSKVFAPISGVVHMVMLKEGEMASPGMPIVQLLNTRKVKVVANVPENYLQAIRKGELVTVAFPALDRKEQARISLIGSTINPSNRTFAVEVELRNPDGMLKPNLLANMLINDYTEENALIIPMDLIQEEVGGQDYVFVKKETDDGPIAEKVYIKAGESFEGDIIIKKGLQKGDVLINEGARLVAENELIEIKEG